MTPEKIRDLRKAFFLTREELGAYVYSTARTVRSWETGDRQMPEAVWELLMIKLYNAKPVMPMHKSEDQKELKL